MRAIMSSSLKPGGSTRQWRKLRAAKAEELRLAGGLPCWRCGRMLYPGDQWCLGHLIDRALGGDDQLLDVECADCSNRSGGRLAHQLKAMRRRPRMIKAPVMARPGQPWPDDQVVRHQQMINDAQLIKAQNDLVTQMIMSGRQNHDQQPDHDHPAAGIFVGAMPGTQIGRAHV